MNSISKIFLMCLAFVVSQAARPTSYREQSFDQKAVNSDRVVLGRVVEVQKGGCGELTSCAIVEVSKTLKGQHEHMITVIYDGPIAEMRPKCCVVGRTYLFFLRQNSDHRFSSIDGPFGIYELGPIDQESLTK